MQPALPDVWVMTAFAHKLLFSHYCDHRKASLCWSLHHWLMWVTAWSLQGSASEAERQRWYYYCKANVISLEPGDLVLVKANAYKGRRKVKDWWEEEQYEVEHRIPEGIPSYLMKNQRTRHSQALHQNWLLFIIPIMGAPLCTGVQAEWK